MSYWFVFYMIRLLYHFISSPGNCVSHVVSFETVEQSKLFNHRHARDNSSLSIGRHTRKVSPKVFWVFHSFVTSACHLCFMSHCGPRVSLLRILQHWSPYQAQAQTKITTQRRLCAAEKILIQQIIRVWEFQRLFSLPHAPDIRLILSNIIRFRNNVPHSFKIYPLLDFRCDLYVLLKA